MSKVIFIIGTLSNGGSERVVSNVSINLPENINKEIILFGQDARIDYKYQGKIVYLDKTKSLSYFSKIITFLNRIIKLKKIKKNNPHATFISFTEIPNLLNILSGSKDKSIVSVRSFMSKKHNKGFKSYIWNLTIKGLYNRVKKIIVVSKQIKVDLIENYKLQADKIEVIYNSYPLKKIKELSSENLNDEEERIFIKPTIITAGRLKEVKGQKHILNAFKKVKTSIPNAQLVFLGEGELEEKLKNQAKELKISESVHFYGFQKNPFKYIAKSKVFVMTSYYEGFPNALAEAMACNVPVISTDCSSGPREILSQDLYENSIENNNENNFGFLVPSFDDESVKKIEDEIYSIMIDLIIDHEKNELYSKRASERVKRFDIQKNIEKWEKLIHE